MLALVAWELALFIVLAVVVVAILVVVRFHSRS
jgi:hypothetical protein